MERRSARPENRLIPALRRVVFVAVASLHVALLASCTSTAPTRPAWAPTSATQLSPPRINEQFRGLWVATVNNIDWPSSPTLPAAAQQAEMRDILDRARDSGFNAILLQVRPTADAVYRSSIEPTSAFITGRQGLDPGYDPLSTWIDEAHARGLELHAWFNPFRTRHPRSIGTDAPSHLNTRRPDLVREHGPYRWADPGDPRSRAHFLRIVEDVLTRYDIDGVHLDDYFYPYPIPGQPIEFDDARTFGQYQASGGKLDRAAWRRSNTDALVRDLHQLVKSTRPEVTVSISPFGIWRPGHPAGIRGMDAHDQIYADSRNWLRQGWVDALMPQLYWPIDPPEQSFPALLQWWDRQNVLARHLWPGITLARTGPRFPQWLEREVPRQLALIDEQNASGVALFSARFIRQRPDFATALRTGAFAQPAVVPDSPWLGVPVPRISARFRDRGSSVLVMETAQPPLLWHISRQNARGQWRAEIQPGARSSIALVADDRSIIVQGVHSGGFRTNRTAFEQVNRR